MGKEANREGEQHIKRWELAVRNLKRLKEQVNSAECELLNATNDLGNWLLPSDASYGEQFCVWYGSEIIVATCNRDGEYTVKKRK